MVSRFPPDIPIIGQYHTEAYDQYPIWAILQEGWKNHYWVASDRPPSIDMQYTWINDRF